VWPPRAEDDDGGVARGGGLFDGRWDVPFRDLALDGGDRVL